MTWFKVDDQFADHPKWAGCTDAAIAAWLKGTAYCSRFKTDGLIPSHIVPTLAKPRTVDELVDRKLWRRVSKGVRVVNYSQHQRTRAEIDKDRERSSERVKRWREKRAGNAVTPASETDTEAETDRTPNPSPEGHEGQHRNCRQCGTNPRAQHAAAQPTRPEPVAEPWGACPHCEGSGIDPATEDRCDCTRIVKEA